MNLIRVTSLLGIDCIPCHRSTATKWFQRHGIEIHASGSDGRKPEAVLLSDLPEGVRRAYLVKHFDGLNLNPGTYDDKAHAAFMEASASRRARAERKAEVARFLLALPGGTKWPERLRLVHAKFGVKGHSKPILKALLTRLKGVDPINFTPALLDGHEAGRPQTDIHAKA